MLIEFTMLGEPSVWLSAEHVIAVEQAEEGSNIFLADNMLYNVSEPVELAVKKLNFAGMLFDGPKRGADGEGQ